MDTMELVLLIFMAVSFPFYVHAYEVEYKINP